MANWIKGAVKPANKGLFGKKAKAAGSSTQAYAAKVISKAKSKPEGSKGSKLLKEALFARTMAKMHGGK